MTRTYEIERYLDARERTVVLVRRSDGTVGAHDLRTGTLLGILDPRDQREQEGEPIPGAGALLWGVAALCVGVLGYVCVHIGMWIARSG